ncbi:MAG: hypothetical protein GDA55_01915 [Cellvibrionales bacterium]|nr:hypothetical protein [Cellvibrionales bacterium]
MLISSKSSTPYFNISSTKNLIQRKALVPYRGSIYSAKKESIYTLGDRVKLGSDTGSIHAQVRHTTKRVFAFLIAKKALGIKDASYKPGKKSRDGLISDSSFLSAFTAAKNRIKAMEFRFIEETNDVRQALLEIYCTVVLKTPYNHFRTH